MFCFQKKSAEKESEQHPREFNVLLLGETGVGKSTLINAFANYVNYKTFDEAARQTKPLCLISTHFQEFTKTINIEGKNNINEGTDPTKSGTHAPSTYSCKSGDLTVRFIDTPGLHDTRGSARDKYNFEKLSSYLSEYEEIHGICILLKPDQQKLTENFIALIKRLIDYFSRDAIENIVFCFTFAKNEMKRKCCPTENAIRTFLTDNNMDYIILNPKEKFYYVDNESFKYLCAKCYDVDYDKEEIANFRKCWDQSETELCRMLHHFWSLEPHSYSQTASLHHYQHSLRKLTKPIGSVAEIIQENIDIMEEQLGKLGNHRADLNGLKELKDRITIENIIITPVKYPPPACRVQIG